MKCCNGGGDGGGGGGGGGGGDTCTGGGNSPDVRLFGKMPSLLPIAPPGGGGGSGPGPSSPCNPPPGLPPGCVTLDTAIALFPEGTRCAGALHIGDLVLTRTAQGELIGERVTALRTSLQPTLLLETASGHSLHCSLSHEIMVYSASEKQGRQILVTRITLDDALISSKGEPDAVQKIERTQPSSVIEISLEGPHHVYLSDGVWSHNKTAPILLPPVGAFP